MVRIGHSTECSATKKRRAAIYVRMSSRPQDRSIEHQCDRLNQYAEEHDIEVVKMYADAGKSGLCINGRDGLQELMADVQARTADFSMVLVYDVSRWGRFQDTDEGAHYEYLCRQAGIQVVYCAEPFANDGSAIASILKGMKRTMAAEYSRELSAKVFAAQCRFAAQGFKMGGYPGYGLRRASYDRNGVKRRVLKPGERKAAATDRVRFCLGPARELAVVRQIYDWYLDDGYGDTKIAALLNEQKVPAERPGPWKPWHIKCILTNEKYMGQAVFNRGSSKMKTSRAKNAPEEWIRAVDAVPAIVSPERFRAAIAARLLRLQPLGRDALLDQLRALYAKHGRVTAEIISAERGVPCPRYFTDRFGTLADAYLFAGLPVTKTLQYARTKHAVRQMLHATVSATKLLIEQAGGVFSPGPSKWSRIINERLVLKIVVARARHDDAGRIRWRIPIHTAPVPDFVLCVQMDSANVGVQAYYLIPVADFTEGHIILRAEVPEDRAQYRHPSLTSVFGRPDSTRLAAV